MPRPGVCAVYSAFHPTQRLLASVEAIRPQVDWTFVVNDAPGPGSTPALTRVRALAGVTVLDNPENLGVAATLNRGIEAALDRGARWVATFDQDSVPPPGFVAGLLAAVEGWPRPDRVGLVAPVVRGARQSAGPRPRAVATAITSGSLVRAEALAQVGLLDEALFIDGVDHDLCLRLARAGWEVVQDPASPLDHRLGDRRVHRVLGVSFSSTHHPAPRRYYMTRNRVVLYRRHGAAAPAWAARDLAAFAKELVKVLLVEEDRTAKLSAVLRGIGDGVRGRMGRG